MNKSLLFVLLFASKLSVAQNSILAGKITDENNAPIPGALIQVTQGKIVSDARSDGDGLYYTQLLPDGNYRVDVSIDGKWYKGRKVYLEAPVHGRRYYDLHLTSGRLVISVDDGDPFLATHIRKVEAEQPGVDFGPGRVGVFELADPVNGSDSFGRPHTRFHLLKAAKPMPKPEEPGEHVPQENK